MKKRGPRILFVFGRRGSDTSTIFGGYAKRLVKRGGLEGIDVHYAALEDLIFEIKNGVTTVVDIRSGESLDSFDWVYFKSWISYSDRAASLAVFLHQKGIPFDDHAVINKGSNSSKLYANMLFWAHDILIPDTFYAAPHHLVQALASSTLEYPLVIKDVYGQKGQSNYLAQSYDEAVKIIQKNPDTDFIVQSFIPNNSDYRVQVYGGKASLVMQRMAQEGSHLNNTSAGGGAKLIDLKDCDSKMLAIAEKAAEVVDLQVSGVDVMPHAKTGKYYILEANQGSQVVTGKFTHENMGSFNSYVKKQAKVRLSREKNLHSKLAIVGRHEIVDLPDLGIEDATAKVDTGAYRSSIHAENIKVVKRGGKDVLQFEIPTVIGVNGVFEKFKKFEVEEFDISDVKKSSTFSEQRYIIRTRLRLGGRSFITSFTLTNRGSMRFPILIGRRVLRGRFIVNPELTHLSEKGK